MACEVCTRLLELLDEQVKKDLSSAKGGYAVPVKPLTYGALASLLNLAVNGPAPAVPEKKVRTVSRTVYSPMMQELVNLRQEYQERIAGLSEEEAAKVQRPGRLPELEWHYGESLRGRGAYAQAFRIYSVTDTIEEPN